MASFGGTTQKCKVCEKTVYLVEQLSADNKVYHKACFRCHHCKGTLKLSNYSSYEGVLYCKPHFDQLLKMTGSLNKSFEGAPRSTRIDISIEPAPVNSKISSLFSGTQDKCVACNKKVYPIEKVAVDGNSYHKACFKCSHGGCVISPSNYIAHEHRLYCRHHHTQLFKQKGNFSKLDRFQQPTRINGTA
ncbi:GATA type zinc finger transcription factor family protein [Perilla frutescens var. hirtella]|uniref:GATA type zinc finger transcription factor family protein n=1 Tax=Perilla frutescens var. hirtella TaxID=608512 RepID=A0AAD4NYC8_PERFH|nr:GATA type zinc finger transcription factor family protein [Perilla frutescens var. hirtella]KAH6797434.1 GATA type zinc finger transcription factor family protein [Perilla frutescens var. hirtella]KAH6798990.1 GATA type zinc finger transcription factor family protein [Perilla frutescens var. frutescens]